MGVEGGPANVIARSNDHYGIPKRTQAQRDVLDRAYRLAEGGILIPSDRDCRQQLRVYERHTANAGLFELHGFHRDYQYPAKLTRNPRT